VFGKDIRALLAISCQKVFFEEGHSFYHYGPVEVSSGGYRTELDLSVASSMLDVLPGVSRSKRPAQHTLLVTDRVYEHAYLKGILRGMFERVEARAGGGVRLKTDNNVLNLCLLSLLLDFGLYEEYAGLLNLPFLQSLKSGDKRQLQVEVSNWIHDFDKKNSADSVTRLKVRWVPDFSLAARCPLPAPRCPLPAAHCSLPTPPGYSRCYVCCWLPHLQVEELLFECSYKFLVNKNFPVQSPQFELIRALNADPAYQQYVLLVKVYMSLCQINKSSEVDYYKVRCNGDYRVIIPSNFSKAISDYLDVVTRQYTFSERGGFLCYDELPLFDLREMQPEINLFKVGRDLCCRYEFLHRLVS
jgi:hypothetical protein